MYKTLQVVKRLQKNLILSSAQASLAKHILSKRSSAITQPVLYVSLQLLLVDCIH